MTKEPLAILKAIGAPDFDTLPPEWRPTVRALERSIQAQAAALYEVETVIVTAVNWAKAGQVTAALRTLIDGHARVANMLGACNRRGDHGTLQ